MNVGKHRFSIDFQLYGGKNTKTFLKTSFYMFHRRKKDHKHLEQHIYNFWVNYLYKLISAALETHWTFFQII